MDLYNKVDKGRINIAELFSGCDDKDLKKKLALLVEIGKNLIVYSSERSLESFMELATNDQKFRYYHHDLKKIYCEWKYKVRIMLETNKKLFDDEYKEFCDVDIVGTDTLEEELPDYPCNYGVKWIENIHREVISKHKFLQKAEDKYIKYLKEDGVQKLKGLPPKFGWEDVSMKFVDNLKVQISVLDRVTGNKYYSFDELGFYKRSQNEDNRTPNRSWFLLLSLAEKCKEGRVNYISILDLRNSLKKDNSKHLITSDNLHQIKKDLKTHMCELFGLGDDPFPSETKEKDGSYRIRPSLSYVSEGTEYSVGNHSYFDDKLYSDEGED